MIEIVAFEGAHVVVAEVAEISPLSKPAYVKGRGEYQGSFIRGGDGDRKLSEYEVGLLQANRGQPRDDREPVDDASAADLDEDAVAADAVAAAACFPLRARTRLPYGAGHQGQPDAEQRQS